MSLCTCKSTAAMEVRGTERGDDATLVSSPRTELPPLSVLVELGGRTLGGGMAGTAAWEEPLGPGGTPGADMVRIVQGLRCLLRKHLRQ